MPLSSLRAYFRRCPCVIVQMRRERLRKLALETVDLNKDPYFMRNHLGTYECKLCLTIHTNEGKTSRLFYRVC
jgi:hypothetical protein